MRKTPPTQNIDTEKKPKKRKKVKLFSPITWFGNPRIKKERKSPQKKPKVKL